MIHFFCVVLVNYHNNGLRDILVLFSCVHVNSIYLAKMCSIFIRILIFILNLFSQIYFTDVFVLFLTSCIRVNIENLL